MSFVSRFTVRAALPAGLAALAVCVVATQAQAGTPAKPVVARPDVAVDTYVNGQPISVNHVLLMSSGLDSGAQARQLDTADARSAARTELITQELLAQEARKAGLDKAPVIADQLAFQDRVILSRAYLEDYFSKNPITDASLKSAYEWKRANGKLLEYKVRQILVATPEAAQDIINRLGRGEDFGALAQRYSQDPGGQATAGDLGWFRPETFVDHHFGDAVAALKKGAYTRTPVRTRFGWHVIRLDDGPRPVANAPAFDALDDGSREALRQKTAQLRIEELTARLTANAKISSPKAATVAKAGP